MKVKKWRPEKLKMVKKHFFPELSGDLWGVICYHHWYPRAGLEGREKSYFSKKKMSLKKMQNYPLSIFHVAVWFESLPGADLSTFEKAIFSLFSILFGPFRAQFSNFLIGRVVGLLKAIRLNWPIRTTSRLTVGRPCIALATNKKTLRCVV